MNERYGSIPKDDEYEEYIARGFQLTDLESDLEFYINHLKQLRNRLKGEENDIIKQKVACIKDAYNEIIIFKRKEISELEKQMTCFETQQINVGENN